MSEFCRLCRLQGRHLLGSNAVVVALEPDRVLDRRFCLPGGRLDVSAIEVVLVAPPYGARCRSSRHSRQRMCHQSSVPVYL